MAIPTPQPVPEPDLAPPDMGSPGRPLWILCLLAMLLGLASLGHFIGTDLGTVREVRAEAVAALAAIEIEGGASAAGAADEARNRRLDAARLAVADAESGVFRGWARLGGYGATFLLLGWFLAYQCQRLRTPQDVRNAGTLVIVLLGLIILGTRLMMERAVPEARPTAWGLADVIILHLLACAILPWSWKDATLPFAVLLVVWAVTFLLPTPGGGEIIDRVVLVMLSVTLLAPGALLAHWRSQRRKDAFERALLEGRVESFGGELTRARIVHDAMFPPSFTGHIAFEYVYEPIQEIGGDYVHTHVSPETGVVLLTLLDVAGHGLAAALTVNRLFGELERILAEHGDPSPEMVMDLLNRYINFTMARHSMYATGCCLRLDPRNGKFEWVSAGHPPALLRRTDGTVETLPTTAVLLGALGPDEFDPDQQEVILSPGDVIIAYTDGAFEARDADGKCFGMDRVRQTAEFHPPPRSWPRFIAGAVAQHHAGAADDDVLIAALTLRSLRFAEAEAPSTEPLTSLRAE